MTAIDRPLGAVSQEAPHIRSVHGETSFSKGILNVMAPIRAMGAPDLRKPSSRGSELLRSAILGRQETRTRQIATPILASGPPALMRLYQSAGQLQHNAVHRQLTAISRVVPHVQTGHDVTTLLQRAHDVIAPSLEAGPAELRGISQRAGQLLRNAAHNAAHLEGRALLETHLEVSFLFIELLKLLSKLQQADKLSRHHERELMDKYGTRQADNLDSQANSTLNTAIGSGLLSILSSLCPLFQHSPAGDKVMEVLPEFMKQGGIPKADLFKGLQKMTESGARISSSTGDIYKLKGDSKRIADQLKQELAKARQDDETSNVSNMTADLNAAISALERLLQNASTITQQTTR